MAFELLVGLRYTRSQKRASGRNRFISFISAVSMFGIALGVAALITVLSVMNGFQEELRSRILGVVAHLQVSGGNGVLSNWPSVIDAIGNTPRVIGSAPYVEAQGLLSYNGVVRGIMVRGVSPDRETSVSTFTKDMPFGSLANLKPGGFGIILGLDLARALAVEPGDRITLIAPQGVVTPAAIVPRLKQFTVVGVFEAGMYEFDSGLALINLQDAQRLYRMGEEVSGVRLKTDDVFDAPLIAAELGKKFSGRYEITNWTQSHANFFRAVALEKTMMRIILTLIVAVAAFNIVSTLVMAVQEKYADIAILRTLGASPLSIMQIFIIQGAIIGLAGLLLGTIGGVLLASNLTDVLDWLEKWLHISLWNKQVYYISQIPSKILWADVASIVGSSFVLTLIATIYPSWRAAKINPAEALRYE